MNKYLILKTSRKVAIFSCLTGQVISVRIDDSKQDHKIQEVRVGQRKEDLSSVGDYYLNCGELLNRLVSS